jgi:hypothetical protein
VKIGLIWLRVKKWLAVAVMVMRFSVPQKACNSLSCYVDDHESWSQLAAGLFNQKLFHESNLITKQTYKHTCIKYS